MQQSKTVRGMCKPGQPHKEARSSGDKTRVLWYI